MVVGAGCGALARAACCEVRIAMLGVVGMGFVGAASLRVSDDEAR